MFSQLQLLRPWSIQRWEMIDQGFKQTLNEPFIYVNQKSFLCTNPKNIKTEQINDLIDLEGKRNQQWSIFLNEDESWWISI